MKYTLAALSLVVFGMLSGAEAGAGAKASVPPFVVTEPTDYKVFQRQDNNMGVVLISGKLNIRGGILERRLIEKSASKKPDSGWSKVAGQDDPEFREHIAVHAGGWYRLEFRFSKDGKLISETAIDHVGVGEVFVIAGQSNSTNHGSEKQRTATGMVSSFDGTKWVLANDPQPGTQDRGSGGSFAPAFGDALFEKFKVPIGIASTGSGATSVRQWLPRGERMSNPPTIESHVTKVGEDIWESTGGLFDGLMQRVDALGSKGIFEQHGVRAILWHQGESDAGQARGGYPAAKQISGAQYAEFMEKLIKASREKAGWEIPWFNAQATYHSEKDASDDEFRTAQKSLWEKGIAHQGPDTDALGKEYRAGVHFNAKGLQAHGILWAEKVGAWLATQMRDD